MQRNHSAPGTFGHNLSLRFSVFLLAVFCPLVPQSVLAQKSISVLAAQAALSSVIITTPTSQGMGVVMLDGTTVATCYHVVRENQTVSVDTRMGRTTGTVIATDEDHDMAIVRIDKVLTPFLQICESRDIPQYHNSFQASMGERWQEPIIRLGVVIGAFEGVSPNLILSSIPQGGDSGGPVMDESGYLIGISKCRATYGAENKLGTGVIPAWKFLEFIQRTQRY